MRAAFRGSSATHILDFTGADWSVDAAFSPAASGALEGRLLAMIGAAYQQVQNYTRTDLLQAATEFHANLEQQHHLLPYHYSYQIGDGRLFGRGSGSSGSFHINRKVHWIQGGAGVCYLQQVEIGPDGRGRVVDTIDIRSQKRVETDDLGPITIYRRKLHITLYQTVPLLVSFLRESKDEVIRVLLTEGKKASLMDLVRLAEVGDGGDDWAEEQIYEMGQAGRAALIAKLGDPKAERHYSTIARLLLTVFPSRESRLAVDQLIEQDKDPERKAAYLIMLSTAPQQD